MNTDPYEMLMWSTDASERVIVLINGKRYEHGDAKKLHAELGRALAAAPVSPPEQPDSVGASAPPTGLCGLRPEPQSVSALRAPIPGAEDGWVQVGSILSGHLRPQPEPWCRSMLLYSPNNAGVSRENRVMLYAASTLPTRVESK